MSKRILKMTLGVAISAACLVLVFRHIDFPELKKALLSARYELVLAAVAVYLFSMVIRSFRWHILLRPVKNVAPLRLFPSIIVGYAANNLLPLRAGEFVRAYFSGQKEGLSRSASFATIMVERIFDGLTMTLLLSVCLFSLQVGTEQDRAKLQLALWLGGAVFAGAFLFCLALLFKRELTLRLTERIFKLLVPGLSEKLLSIMHKFLSGLEVLRSTRDLLLVLGLSLLVWLCEAFMYALIGLSLGLGEQIPFVNHVVVLAIINLFIMIPAGPGFAGTFEAAGTWTLAMYGVSPTLAVSYVLLIHLGQYLSTTLLGLFYLWRYNVSLWAAQRDEAADENEPTI
jgi:glycosyltransferase 2 family protein